MRKSVLSRERLRAAAMAMIFLLIYWLPLHGQGGAPAGSSSITAKCGAAHAGSNTLNLTDEATCTALDIVNHKRDPEVFNDYFDTLMYLAIERGVASQEAPEQIKAETIVKAETKRTDKQIGASASAQGSTSAAEKANFADLLAVAVENGTIQKESNGTTLTLSSSPYALTALGHGDTPGNYKAHENDLGRVGVSATFNIANQSEILSNATRKQLAEWSVRIRLNRDHTTRSQTFEDWWMKGNIPQRLSEEAIVVTRELQSIFSSADRVAAKRVIQDKFLNSKLSGNPAPLGDGFIKTYLVAHTGDSDDQLVSGLRDEILLELKREVSDKIDSFGLEDAEKKRIVNSVVVSLKQAHSLA